MSTHRVFFFLIPLLYRLHDSPERQQTRSVACSEKMCSQASVSRDPWPTVCQFQLTSRIRDSRDVCVLIARFRDVMPSCCTCSLRAKPIPGILRKYSHYGGTSEAWAR